VQSVIPVILAELGTLAVELFDQDPQRRERERVERNHALSILGPAV